MHFSGQYHIFYHFRLLASQEIWFSNCGNPQELRGPIPGGYEEVDASAVTDHPNVADTPS